MTLRTLSKRMMILASMVTLFIGSVYAAPVDPNRALNVAEQFMPSKPTHKKKAKGTPQQVSEIVYTHYMPQSGRPAIYVVNINGGFALISADDVAHPVLGYNYGKPWPTNVDSIAPSVKGFLDDLAAQMEAASGHPQDAATAAEWRQPNRSANRAPRRTAANPSLPDSVGPLLTTTWDQGQYYNAMCPVCEQGPYDGHCPTGCVATAMAQIIKYWGYPIHGRGAHAYNTSNVDPNSMSSGINTEGYGTLFVDFSQATYDYAHMPDALTAGSSQVEIDAVAQLMYHCGVAVNMFYGAGESGAMSEDVRSALISYFGFAPSLGYADKQLYSDQAWEDSLRANIDRGEPVYYTGVNVFSSHAFVCDGYKQDGYFHFNFGWGGFANGWYLTKAIDANMGYSEWPSAIMGIRPDSLTHAIICQKEMYLQNIDSFMVTEPVDLFPLRGASEYLAVNEMKGVRIDLILSPKDSLDQLMLDIITFDKEQSVVIYDGINKDSLLRVIETRNLDDYSTVTYKTWLYNGLPSDTIYQNLAGTNLSPILSTRHGLTIVVYSYGGLPEGFHIRARNASDATPIDSVSQQKRYWKDVVNSEPDGYVLESDSIKIYSAEGLAWLGKYLDSLWVNGINYTPYTGKVLSIENDLDFQGYLWTPIRGWGNNIEGNGHLVYNLDVSTSESGGLFSSLFGIKVINLGIINAKVNAVGGSGAIAGYIDNCIIENCYSIKHFINSGNGVAGGLVGYASNNSQIRNCYAYGDVCAQFGYGGIAGHVEYVEMCNCISQLGEGFKWYSISFNGLLTGEVHGGSFANCFSDISMAKRQWDSTQGLEYDSLARRAYFLGNVYNVDAIEDLAAFNILIDTTGALIADTACTYTLGEHMDIITALNKKVAEYNSPNYKTWVRDSVTHLPVFGDFYEVVCPNISNLSAANIPYNDDFAVALTWQENGEASEWQVKYNIKHAPESDATIYIINSTQDTVTGLLLGNEYSFYIRPLCGGEDTIGWGQPFNFYVDKTLWIDMVNVCPVGYVEKNNNVYISSSEALAWLTKNWWYREDTIFIMSDLDMGAYRWTPIGHNHFRGHIEGNNHTISNLYCSENILDPNAKNIGLVGYVANNASFNNIKIKNSIFKGNHNVGSLFGMAWNSTVNNCHAVEVNVTGLYEVGGLGGALWTDGGLCKTYNSSVTGTIYGDQSAGGLYASKSGELINCYSRCNVQPLGIRNEGPYEGRGGLLGASGGITINCYSASIVGTHNNDPENVVGSAVGIFGNGELRNVYALALDSIPFVGTVEENFLFADTASLVNTTIQTITTISDTPYTDLLSALNAWVDANNSEGKYIRWKADFANINNGYPIYAESERYIILFQDWDGTILSSQLWEEGTMPSCMEPIRPATAQYTYTFAGWSPEIVTATGEATYVAQYDSVVNKYLVVFTNEWGVELKRDSVEYGQAATPPDFDNVPGWRFVELSGSYSYITEDTYLVAYYVRITHYIEFRNFDNTVLLADWYVDGERPIYYGSTPIKPATAQYTYSFAGWAPEIVVATCEATYIAQYDSVVNMYAILFLNYDGSMLSEDVWEYGVLPTYTPEPIKPETADSTYTFAGWIPEVVAVTEDAIYTATYTATPKVVTGMENPSQTDIPQKIMIDGQIYILRGDKIYSIEGHEMK